jgi:phosphate transport system permease protein
MSPVTSRNAGPAPTAPAAPRAPVRRGPRRTLIANYGEPAIWMTGGALAIGLLMVVGLLGLVLVRGLGTLWPAPIVQVALADGSRLLGQIEQSERYRPQAAEIEALGARRSAVQAALDAAGGTLERRLLRLNKPGAEGENFNRWVPEYLLEPAPGSDFAAWESAGSSPAWALCVERYAGGRLFSVLEGFARDGQVSAQGPEAAWRAFEQALPEARSQRRRRLELEEHAVGRINDQLEDLRLALRRAELRHGTGSGAARLAQQALAEGKAASDAEMLAIRAEIETIVQAENRSALLLRGPDGAPLEVPLGQVVRAHAPNRLGWFGRLAVYGDRWVEFVSAEPRKGFQEGGVFPAIFGTVVMTLIMSLLVVPFGVLAALYLREYAKQGVLVSAVRIAVNNLAGVPSIVFGVFGLGFFCYLLGKGIDGWFYPERLPNPTFGKGGLLWASATLALLTLPVVIVATEEALAAVPSSMREGSYACGASKWQTIRRIVLPRALPGIMTGMVLAVARGAGEVAPLMLVGVAALAPELPFSLDFPEFGTNRSFMHLGYQIYEMGFKSPDAEASIPFVFTTTLLLIAIIVVLNVSAIRIRSRLRRRFRMA